MNVHAFAPEAAETETAVPRCWRVAALARRIDCPRQSLYAEIKAGRLRAIRLFGSLRVREDDVLAYIAEREGRR